MSTQASQHLRYHLFSSVVLSVWTVLIIFTVVIHERSASLSMSPTDTTARRLRSWAYKPDGLPSLTRTIFSQAHTTVTVMHLARLAAGAVTRAGDVPRTWYEGFLLADKRWAGPIDLILVCQELVRKRLWVSRTFVTFTVISVISLITPLIWDRTYSLTTFDIPVPTVVEAVDALRVEYLAGVFPASQIVIGNSLWTTGRSVPDMFSRNAYPVKMTSPTGGQQFFTGELQNETAALFGIAINGTCDGSNTAPKNDEEFRQLCEAEFGASLSRAIAPTRPLLNDGLLNISGCSNIGPGTLFGQRPEVASTVLLWYRELGGQFNEDCLPVGGPSRSNGVVRCSVTSAAGQADVDGQRREFRNFRPAAVTYLSGNDAGSLDPVAAMLASMSGQQLNPTGPRPALYTSIQYKLLSGSVNGSDCIEPTFIAATFWDSITSMGMAAYLLSKEKSDQPGFVPMTLTGSTRDTGYLAGLITLLGAWALGVALATAKYLRPAFCDGLESYAMARLWAGRFDLVSEGVEVGTAEENVELLQAFPPVKPRNVLPIEQQSSAPVAMPIPHPNYSGA